MDPGCFTAFRFLSAVISFSATASQVGSRNVLSQETFWIDSLAILITAAGIGLAIWARFYLGDNWSSAVSIKVDHQLIRTGPYAWVRHPIYTGILLGMIGTALARREPRGVFRVVLLGIGFWIKSRMEEGFMSKTFGEEYEVYSRSTGALIPRVRL